MGFSIFLFRYHHPKIINIIISQAQATLETEEIAPGTKLNTADIITPSNKAKLAET